MFGFDDFTELSNLRDLEKILIQQNTSNGAASGILKIPRFVTLAMPRVLSRLPYGDNSKPVEEFRYEEFPLDASGKAKNVGHDQYAWMNAAYVMGTTMTKAFAEYGWCTAIRGAEGGGKVEGLPTHLFQSDEVIWIRSVPPRSESPNVGKRNCPSLAFCPCVTTRTRIMRCSSEPKLLKAKSTIRQTLRRMRRSPHACLTSWRPRALLIT